MCIYTPDPFTVTESGDLLGFGSFDGICRIALRFPAVEGVKVTVTVHVPSVTRVEPEQVSAARGEKSAGWSPAMVIAPITRSVIPLFVSVTVLLTGVPTATFPKLTIDGFLVIFGGFTLALRRTTGVGFFGSFDTILSLAVFVS